MSSIFETLPLNTYRKPQGSLFIEPIDPVTLEPVGRLQSVGSCKLDLSVKSEFSELRENQSQFRDISYRRAVQSDVTLKMGIMQFTPTMLAAMHGAAAGASFTQSAYAATSQEFDAVEDQDVLELVDPKTGTPVFGATITSITDGAAPLPQGTYKLDAITGIVQIVKAPASGSVSVSYSAPAIAAGANSLFAIVNQPEFMARVVVRQNNRDGANLYYTFPKVQIPSAQQFTLIGNDNNYQNVELDCTVLYDSRFTGREKGWSATL